MNKIAIVGSGGSGKSTLSRQLHSILNIPDYHLDIYFWKPGWVETDSLKWFEINDELMQKDCWIIDGNFKSTMGQRMGKADTIIFLDFWRFSCLYRAFKRFFKYRKVTRLDLSEGCFEKIDFSYYKWIWIYPRKFKPITLQNIEKFGKNKNVYILRNKREVESFVEKVKTLKPLKVLQP